MDDAFVVDHSAHDAYALRIDSDRRRLYSGNRQRLAPPLAPAALVHGYTFQADKFAEVFGSHMTRRYDGEWWEG